MRAFVFFVMSSLLLSACNSATPDASAPRFDPAEAAYINAPGKGVIDGHAFLRDKHGQINVRYAAGEIVRLVPATAYAQARFAHFYGGSKFVPASSLTKFDQNPDYVALTRTTKSESTGRFTFENVAPGRYYVTTQLTWKPKDSFMTEGGAMYEEVTVTGKETDPIKVVLSGS